MMKLYTGCVENRFDPLKLGRCQVRIVGLHTENKVHLPTTDLPWAYPVSPITSAGTSGIGASPIGPVEGSWVLITFMDADNQQPMMLGIFHSIQLMLLVVLIFLIMIISLNQNVMQLLV